MITSNRTRELHDALTRRCLYHWVDYPSVRTGGRVILTQGTRVGDHPWPPFGRGGRFASLRGMGLTNSPLGASEAIDWARSLAVVGVASVGTIWLRRPIPSVRWSRITTIFAVSAPLCRGC